MLRETKSIPEEADRLIRKKIPLATILLFFACTAAHAVASLLFLNRAPRELRILVFFLITVFFISAYMAVIKKAGSAYDREKRKVVEEMDFLSLMSENVNDLMLLLDEFGIIRNINRAFARTLGICMESAAGKPFREIFNLPEPGSNLFFRKVILDNLNEVFRMRSSDFILPIKLPGYQENKSIYIKLIPIVADGKLKNILATGRLLGSDYITNRWLKREESSYEMDNSVSYLILFCHRLTRNLEGKIGHSEILL
ncbi:MAG TPA: PAS domain S-box protein, partial [Spirochaetota bacterium]|nr:PAS domain S-box protein [Spirochaetota bacterium]